MLLVRLILSLGIAILGFGDYRLVSVVHFNLTVSHVFVNRRDLHLVHGMFKVSHRLLILLGIDDEIIGGVLYLFNMPPPRYFMLYELVGTS